MISTTKMWTISGTAVVLALAGGTMNTGCTVNTTTPADGGTGSGSSGSGSSSGGTSSGMDSGTSSGMDSGTSSGGPDTGSDAGFCFSGTSPAAGETLVALSCSQASPSGIAVHKGVVYWTDYTAAGTVMSEPAAGGPITTIAINQDWPYAIAVDDDNVYWTNYDGQYAPGGGSGTSGTVMKMALTGGGTPIALASNLQGPTAIAIDATNVYFAQSVGGTIKSVPIASTGSGPVTVLATAQTPYGIAVQNNVVYWTNYGGITGPTGNSYASVMSVSNSGTGTPAILTTATNAEGAYGIAVNATTIFFTAQNNTGNATEVESLAIGGGNPTVLASGQLQATGIAIDGTSIYWTDWDPNVGTVSSMPLPTAAGPGPITVLAQNSDEALRIAVDAQGIYYTATGGSRVWRLTPP